MSAMQLLVFASGAAALLSVFPLLQALRANMELTRARVFLRWKPYTRTLRLVALAGAAFVAVLIVATVVASDDYVIRTFIPVGLFQLLLQVAAVYYGLTIYAIGRGPRAPKAAAAGLLLALSPAPALRSLLVATGVPALAMLLVLALLVPYRNEVVKARYYLHFAGTNRVTERLVMAIAACFVINLAYAAWRPDYLQETAFLAPTGLGIVFVHLMFVIISWFVVYSMKGLSRPRR